MALGYDPTTNPTTEATADTPDPTRYHASKGLHGTMLPRSKGAGGSHGFDAHAGGILNVIVADEEGMTTLVTVDMANVTQSRMLSAVAAASGQGDAWRRLAASQDEVEVSAPSAVSPMTALNPIMPGYVVPPSTVGGSQLPYDQTNIVPAVQIERSPMSESDASTGAPKQKRVSRQEALLEQMVLGLNKLSGLIVQQQKPPVAVTSSWPSVAPLPPVSPQPSSVSLPPVPAIKPVAPPAAVDAFASLQIPWLQPEAKKPTKQVYFDLGIGGQVSWRFHEVQVTETSIILYHDDRWDSGGQWLPPYIEEGTIRVTVPDLGRSFQVYSKDCVFGLGVIEGCILPLVVDAGSQPDNDDPRPRSGSDYEDIN